MTADTPRGGWRDIESAPRDGTVFLAAVPCPPDYPAEFGPPEGGWWWMLAEWDRQGREVWSCYWDGDPPSFQPTKWQPLPAPPETENG